MVNEKIKRNLERAVKMIKEVSGDFPDSFDESIFTALSDSILPETTIREFEKSLAKAKVLLLEAPDCQAKELSLNYVREAEQCVIDLPRDSELSIWKEELYCLAA